VRSAIDGYAELLARARAGDEVVGVIVVGSQAGPFVTAESDVDLVLVVRDGADPRPWRTPHGSPVEVWPMDLTAFRAHALPGDDGAWNRPSWIRARVDLDKLDGEIATIVDRKRRLGDEEARQVAALALDDAINSIYRALRNLEGGRELAGRLDGREAIEPLLTTAFALEGRVRPWNKYLEADLAEDPLRTAAFDGLGARIRELGDDPSADRLRGAFRMLEGAARAAGHGDVVDGWEPDVAWLRGEAGSRV
jgi:hypothetical protein